MDHLLGWLDLALDLVTLGVVWWFMRTRRVRPGTPKGQQPASGTPHPGGCVFSTRPYLISDGMGLHICQKGCGAREMRVKGKN